MRGNLPDLENELHFRFFSFWMTGLDRMHCVHHCNKKHSLSLLHLFPAASYKLFESFRSFHEEMEKMVRMHSIFLHRTVSSSLYLEFKFAALKYIYNDNEDYPRNRSCPFSSSCLFLFEEKRKKFFT